MNHKSILTRQEEELLLGMQLARKSAGRDLPKFGDLDVLTLPRSNHLSVVENVENRLQSLAELKLKSEIANDTGEFPFKRSKVDEKATCIEAQILKDLTVVIAETLFVNSNDFV